MEQLYELTRRLNGNLCTTNLCRLVLESGIKMVQDVRMNVNDLIDPASVLDRHFIRSFLD